MSADEQLGERLDPDQLRTLFLFEALEPNQLDWLSEHGHTEERTAGAVVYAEGDPAGCFYVLLDGTVSMHRQVENTEVETIRTSQRGVYSGATQAFLPDPTVQRYLNSLRAVTACTFWVVDGVEFGTEIRGWFPMAMHMLEGLTLGFRASQAMVGQRERLLSLGRLSAGLTHELNNPAAAAVRATAALRERVSRMRGKLAHLAGANLSADALAVLTELQENAVERMAKRSGPDVRSAVEVGDAEDELADWLDEHDLTGGWDLAPVLVAAGVDVAWLEEVAAAVPPELLSDGLTWVTYALDTEQLMSEIEDSTGRISTLVAAAKQYTQVDRATGQDVDLRDGLVSTLVMLHHKIAESGTITVVKDFDPDLPSVPAHPAELNQVWTNLIDNAIGAMPDGGTLTVRTIRDGEYALVEVADTGTGIPAEVRDKIFEPFFTTKPVGEGTGLGLDISYRVVTQRHGGDITVRSEPGHTRFQVRLPLTARPAR